MFHHAICPTSVFCNLNSRQGVVCWLSRCVESVCQFIRWECLRIRGIPALLQQPFPYFQPTKAYYAPPKKYKYRDCASCGHPNNHCPMSDKDVDKLNKEDQKKGKQVCSQIQEGIRDAFPVNPKTGSDIIDICQPPACKPLLIICCCGDFVHSLKPVGYKYRICTDGTCEICTCPSTFVCSVK